MPSTATFQPLRTRERVAKAVGADVELANFIEGADHAQKTGRAASRLLLREIDGVSQSGLWHTQDWGRKFLPANGGCAYIDLDHLELPLPEVVSAYDFVAAWHAMLRIARQALGRVNENAEGLRVRALANNSDGLGNSYGSHVNVLLTRRAFDNIFHRKIHQMLWLAAYQVSSVVFTGQGKVGAENGAPSVSYQISQRADFFETLTGVQTTERRPLVNCRDEPLCGKRYRGDPDSREAPHLARLHVIFYDSNLCHVACLLKIGVLQIALAMLEAEQINPELILDDPVAAVVAFSHDPTLQRKARLASGAQLSAVDLQRRFWDDACAFCDRGGCESIVPQAEQILSLWGDVLDKLAAGDFDALAGSLDWVLKMRCLERAMAMNPQLAWDSPAIKHLDHLYSSLDEADGLYWACERAGRVERVASDAQIERLQRQPPQDTRAWTRAMLLRLAGPEQIHHIDWDHIEFRLARWHGWPDYRTLWMPDPLGMGQAEASDRLSAAASLEEAIDALADCHESDERPAWIGRPPLRALPAPEQTSADSNDPADSQPLLPGDQTDAIS